ncbi:type VI secretion system tube protein Hcp [Chitinivorax sp. B]|uniref:Hcp family type VI secretion system effector n=1 Tax=Chitinivorax sp. B TaxID=2502235 RepID=UPI0010F7F278|nr:type VI secretion system tube protein Hcp [Chitinivorax sp. B]
MILLKFGTEIKGTSTIDGHTDWITIESMQFGVGRAISAVSGGTDRETSNPSFSELTFTKATDIASPELFMQSICGKSLTKAEIHFLHTGGADKKQQVYLKIELEAPIVSSYSVSSGGDRPSESFSLNFTKISYQYDAFSGDTIKPGTPKKWDLQKNATY